MSEDRKTVIKFDNVTKRYKLFKSDRQQLLHVFSRKKRYTEKEAIKNLSFEIKKGEAVAFLGKNGAGKSTLLKMITGVSFPTEGDITVDGRVSALLELTAGFDSEFTGRGNIFLKGQLMGVPEEEMKRLEQDIIDFADIGEYIDQPVRTYSSGMKARLGFAINVNIMPEILIVDEALSVGDKAFRTKCLDKIRELLDDHGITFLFVTHSTDTARDFCSRGILMRNGEMVFDGDIDDAINKYNDLLEADIKKERSKKA